MTPFSISREANNAPALPATAANQEWPTFALHLGRTSRQTSWNKQPKSRHVQIDTLTTKDDLAALKKKDPFLYYSIPSVRTAEMTMGKVDVSCIEKSSVTRSAFTYSKMQTQAEKTSKIVNRKTCISFECHIDKMMAGYLIDCDTDDLSDIDDKCDDLFLDMLSRED